MDLLLPGTDHIFILFGLQWTHEKDANLINNNNHNNNHNIVQALG